MDECTWPMDLLAHGTLFKFQQCAQRYITYNSSYWNKGGFKSKVGIYEVVPTVHHDPVNIRSQLNKKLILVCKTNPKSKCTNMAIYLNVAHCWFHIIHEMNWEGVHYTKGFHVDFTTTRMEVNLNIEFVPIYWCIQECRLRCWYMHVAKTKGLGVKVKEYDWNPITYTCCGACEPPKRKGVTQGKGGGASGYEIMQIFLV